MNTKEKEKLKKELTAPLQRMFNQTREGNCIGILTEAVQYLTNLNKTGVEFYSFIEEFRFIRNNFERRNQFSMIKEIIESCISYIDNDLFIMEGIKIE